MSDVRGDEAIIGIPIVIGQPGTDDTPTAAGVFCPATMPATVMPIVGVQWMWAGNIGSDGDTLAVDDPLLYTLMLNPDGSFNAQADCNLSAGSFTLGDPNLALNFGPTTLAECSPASLSSEFLQNLSGVSAFTVNDDGNLALSLGDLGGEMVLTPMTEPSAQEL